MNMLAPVANLAKGLMRLIGGPKDPALISTGDIHAPTVIQNNYITVNWHGPPPEEGFPYPEIPRPPDPLLPPDSAQDR